MVGLSRLFLLLADRGLYQLADADMHIWWHIIFYLGMTSFILFGRNLKIIVDDPNQFRRSWRHIVLSAFSLLISVGIFFIAQLMESFLSPILAGSIIERIGLYHMIAMTLAFIAVVYIYRIKVSWGKTLTVSIWPLLIFLFLMSVQHMWEMLMENWRVITLPSMVIEQVEQFIVAPALIFLSIGFFRIANRMMHVNQNPIEALQIVVTDSE